MYFIIAFIIIVLSFIVYECILRFKELYASADVHFQHSRLPNYFSALRRQDCEEFVEDEELFKQFGFNILNEEAMEKCREAAL